LTPRQRGREVTFPGFTDTGVEVVVVGSVCIGEGVWGRDLPSPAGEPREASPELAEAQRGVPGAEPPGGEGVRGRGDFQIVGNHEHRSRDRLVGPYDEDTVLSRYIFNNYGYLLTDAEEKASRVLAGGGHCHASPAERRRSALRAVYGTEQSKEFDHLLRDGEAAFRRRARDRILREHVGEVLVLRCPRCKSVVRTPRARQCLWCGLDWHRA
jgi:hypothetical protein